MPSFDSFNPERVPTAKLATHALQIVLAFVGWCMEIAVFVNDEAVITGQIGWTFAVVCLPRFAVDPRYFAKGLGDDKRLRRRPGRRESRE